MLPRNHPDRIRIAFDDRHLAAVNAGLLFPATQDLKHGVGLNHLPSGRFAANAAWLAVQVMAHNLARRTAHPLGPPTHPASDTALARSPSLTCHPWCQRQRLSLRWIRAYPSALVSTPGPIASVHSG